MDWLAIKKHKGIVDCTEGQEYWNSRELTRMDSEGWIKQNWDAEWHHALRSPVRRALVDRLLSTGGPILEVAAGPGGGNLAPILRGNKSVGVIVNDIEGRILQRWSSFIEGLGLSSRVAFLACDAASLPLADGSVAAISSRGGISNAMGNHRDILKECSRVLRPGGVVGTYELSLSEKTLTKMPQDLREAWGYNAFLFRDWDALIQEIGLVTESKAAGERFLLDTTTALGMDAAGFGLVLEVEMMAVVMVKMK